MNVGSGWMADRLTDQTIDIPTDRTNSVPERQIKIVFIFSVLEVLNDTQQLHNYQ